MRLRSFGVTAIVLLGLYHLAWQLLSSSTLHHGAGCPRAGTNGATRSGPSSVASGAGGAAGRPHARDWQPPPQSNLHANPPARTLLAAADPTTTTLVFTFGSVSMLTFLRNWLHFVNKAGLAPALVGAADVQMLQACTAEDIAALGISSYLDVWTYARTRNASTVVQSGKSEWK